jgi:hypothetical protein
MHTRVIDLQIEILIDKLVNFGRNVYVIDSQIGILIQNYDIVHAVSNNNMLYSYYDKTSWSILLL